MTGAPGGPIFLFRYYSITVKTTKLQMVTIKIKKTDIFQYQKNIRFLKSSFILEFDLEFDGCFSVFLGCKPFKKGYAVFFGIVIQSVEP